MSSEQPRPHIARPSFVGRETERRQLEAAFDRAMAGEGSLAMVVGEPGIGKTSLCEQLAVYVKEKDGTTLVGHCYEEGSLSLPYLAFVEAIRSYVLDRETDDLKAELGQAAGPISSIVPEIRDRLGIQPASSGNPEEDRYRLLQGVTSFLGDAASVHPMLIVLEDLHDADSGTLDMLTYMARNLGGVNLLIVGTYRDIEVDRAHPLSSTLADLRKLSSFSRIGLRGLTADEVSRMMSQGAGRDVSWGLAEAVHRQTEGNPLFVQEVLRHLVEEGAFEGEGGADVEATLATSIPEGLRDVIGKRLTRMSAECNKVLSVASVIGREFRLDVLERVTRVPDEDLFSALEEAAAAGVVEERSTARSVVNYRFAHAFFRQTLYEETIAPRRIRLHQQVARALVEVHAGRLDEHATELAEHFSYSSDDEDLATAIRYGEVAAERALAVYAFREAVVHVDRCLQVQEVLDPENRERRCDLLLDLCKALMPAGESVRAYEDVTEEAFALAESIEDSGRAVRSCFLAVEAAQRLAAGGLGQTSRFREWTVRADRHAAPGTRDRVMADLVMSIPLRVAQEYSAAYPLRRRAVDLSRELGDPQAFLTAGEMFVGVDWGPQHFAERFELARELADTYQGLDASSRTESGTFSGRSLLDILGWLFLVMGERARAEEIWAQTRVRASHTNDPNLIIGSLQNQAITAILDGHLEEAVRVTDRMMVTGEELGIPLASRALGILSAAYSRLHLGTLVEIADEVREFFERLQVSDSAANQWPFFEAVSLAVTGKTEEALAISRRLYAAGNYGDFEDETSSARLINMMHLAVLAGDRETVEALYPRLGPLDEAVAVGWELTSSGRLLGDAAAMLGDHKAARAHYLKALELMGRVRFRPEIALTRLHMAELLLGHYPDERGEAKGHLEFAIPELREMKMQPALDRAMKLQEKLGSPKGGKIAYPDGLSQREVEVLRLIARGRSNQNIADELFISISTVAHHVTSILNKTGSSNRAEAATYASRNDLA